MGGVGGKAKAYFWVQGWVGGLQMAFWGRTYFMDGPKARTAPSGRFLCQNFVGAFNSRTQTLSMASLAELAAFSSFYILGK